MFKVECFVEDNKLAQVLHALAGLAYDVKPVPVVNAKHVNGTMVPRVGGNGKDIVFDALKKTGKKEFVAADIKAALKTLGRSSNGYHHYARELVKAHRLKPHKKGGGKSSHMVWTIAEAKS